MYEKQVLRWIQSESRDFQTRFVHFFLYLFSLPYRLGSRIRNWAYDHGWLQQYQSPVPVVVSIGNLVAGGSGKTPITQLFVKTFSKQIETAVVSRGYRSPIAKLTNPIQICYGNGPVHPASYCGDEPYLIASNAPEILSFVGRSRKKAANMAAAAGARLMLLDDGMQHRQLARDVEVVVMDVKDPFGKGYFLPRGLLRDNLSSLKRADLVILNHVEDMDQFHTVESQVERYTDAPIVGVHMAVAGIWQLDGTEIKSLKGKKVGIFCGIAQPDNFEKSVVDLGAEVVNRSFVADHIVHPQHQLEKFVESSMELGAEYIICTEKDKVKLPEDLELELPVLWIKAEIALVQGQEKWDDFVENMKEMLAERS